MFLDFRDVIRDVKMFGNDGSVVRGLKIFGDTSNDASSSRFYQYIEWFVISSLLILVASQLAVFLNVDVWRQDSMRYVSTYADKLSEEGRWINYLLFKILKVTPAAFCVLASYLSLAFFTFSVTQRVVSNWKYSLALALLILTNPVLAVLLEWPDTLLPAFLLLAVAVVESRKLPDYVFFSVFSCLFFGTYSALYFLLPLLFWNELRGKNFLRLGFVWIFSFVGGYCFTNGIVHHMTGDYIKISSWREPHYIESFSDALINVDRIAKNLTSHTQRYYDLVSRQLFNAVLVYLLFNCRSLSTFWAIIVGLACSLAIYVTAIPLGIIIQERTTLVFWVAVLCVLFYQKNSSRGYRVLGLCLMLLVGVKLSAVSYSSITSYSAITNSLVNQIKITVPYKPEEVNRVYIIVTIDEAEAAFSKLQKNIEYQNHFSEGISAPLAWLSAFKYIGYKNVVLCVNEESGWCAEPVAYNKNNPWVHDESGHVFRSYRFNDDVVFTVN